MRSAVCVSADYESLASLHVCIETCPSVLYSVPARPAVSLAVYRSFVRGQRTWGSHGAWRSSTDMSPMSATQARGYAYHAMPAVMCLLCCAQAAMMCLLCSASRIILSAGFAL